MVSDDAGFYKILGVPHDATLAQIRRAYLKIARNSHPDRCVDKDAHFKLAAVGEAWAVLRDPRLRAVYDSEGKDGLDMLSDDEGNIFDANLRADVARGSTSDGQSEDEISLINAFLAAGDRLCKPSVPTSASYSHSDGRVRPHSPRETSYSQVVGTAEASEAHRDLLRVQAELSATQADREMLHERLGTTRAELTAEQERRMRETRRAAEAERALEEFQAANNEVRDAVAHVHRSSDSTVVEWQEDDRQRFDEEVRLRCDAAVDAAKAAWMLGEESRVQEAVDAARADWEERARAEWEAREASRREAHRTAILAAAADERAAALRKEQKKLQAIHDAAMQEALDHASKKLQEQEADFLRRAEEASEIAAAKLKEALATERAQLTKEWTARMDRTHELAIQQAREECDARTRVEHHLLRQELRREADERVGMKAAMAAAEMRKVEADAMQKVEAAAREAASTAARTIKVQAAQLAAQQCGGIPRAVIEAAAAPLVESGLESIRQEMRAGQRAEVERATEALQREAREARQELAEAKAAREVAEREKSRLELLLASKLSEADSAARFSADADGEIGELKRTLALACSLFEQVKKELASVRFAKSAKLQDKAEILAHEVRMALRNAGGRALERIGYSQESGDYIRDCTSTSDWGSSKNGCDGSEEPPSATELNIQAFQARLTELSKAEERGRIAGRVEAEEQAEKRVEEAVRTALQGAAERSDEAADKMMRSILLSLRDEAPETVRLLVVESCEAATASLQAELHRTREQSRQLAKKLAEAQTAKSSGVGSWLQWS